MSTRTNTNILLGLTFRLTLSSEVQLMIPHLVLFIGPHSAANYELFFVEVKRKGKYPK